MHKKVQAFAIGAASLAVIGVGTGVVEASTPTYNPVYSACLTTQHTLINVTRSPARPVTCPRGTLSAHWNATGPAGPRGATGANGAPGANGSTVLNGSGAPSSATGNVGDFYIDTTNFVMYGPKAASGWPTPGHNLQGPAGPSGGSGGNPVTAAVVRGSGVSLPADTSTYSTVATYSLPPGKKFVAEAKVVISNSGAAGNPLAATCQLGFSNGVPDQHPDTATVDLGANSENSAASATLTLMNDYDTTQQPGGSANFTVQLACINRNSPTTGVDEVATNGVIVITQVDNLDDDTPGEVYNGPPA